MTTLEQSGTGAGAGSALLSDGRIGTAVGAAVDWVTSTDHKKIGRLFTGFGILGMIAMSVIAVLRSLESVADLGAFNAQQLDQLTQLHHFGLALMVALPLTLGLSIAVAPMQVGARAIAFARLALMGFYMWLAGAVLTIVAIVNGGGIGGADSDMVDLFLAAMALMMFGVIASAISVATTILTSRAPGVTMRRVPFLTWTALVQSLALIITAPVGPKYAGFSPDYHSSIKSEVEYHTQQIASINKCGVDVISIAVMPSGIEAIGAAIAASKYNTPYTVGFAIRADGCLLGGMPAHTVIEQIEEETHSNPPIGYIIGCTHPSIAAQALNKKHRSYDKIIGIKANGACKPPKELLELKRPLADPPAQFASELLKLGEPHGFKIYGGCCGTDSNHIEALAKQITLLRS